MAPGAGFQQEDLRGMTEQGLAGVTVGPGPELTVILPSRPQISFASEEVPGANLCLGGQKLGVLLDACDSASCVTADDSLLSPWRREPQGPRAKPILCENQDFVYFQDL